MIRVYRNFVEQCLLASTYLLDYRGTSFRNMLDEMRGHRVQSGSTSEQLQFNNAIKVVGASQDSITSLKETCIKLLKQESNPQGERDLIDQLVRVLQLPNGRNTLSGNTLKALSQALLLPAELGGLVERLRRREMSCASCGSALHTGEAITLNVIEHVPVFSCSRCAMPSCVSCATCRTSAAALSQKAQAALSKLSCQDCLAKIKVGVKPILPSNEASMDTFSIDVENPRDRGRAAPRATPWTSRLAGNGANTPPAGVAFNHSVIPTTSTFSLGITDSPPIQDFGGLLDPPNEDEDDEDDPEGN